MRLMIDWLQPGYWMIFTAAMALFFLFGRRWIYGILLAFCCGGWEFLRFMLAGSEQYNIRIDLLLLFPVMLGLALMSLLLVVFGMMSRKIEVRVSGLERRS